MDRTAFRIGITRMWLALALLAALVFGLRLFSMLRDGAYSYTTGTEEMSIFNASRIAHGEPIYVDCFAYPYRTSLYNWLFYVSYGWVVQIVAPSELELPNVLRLTTLAWAALGCLASFILLYRYLTPTLPRRGWLAFGVAFVTWFGPNLGWWTMTARPDLAALALAICGLGLVAGSEQSRSIGRALAAGVCFYLAWSFKQSEIGILLGCGVALLYRREWLNIVLMSVPFVLLTLLTLALASEEHLVNILVLPRLARLNPGQVPRILISWIMDWGFVLPTVFFLLLRLVPKEKRGTLWQSRPISIFAIVLLVTTALGLITSFRFGAWSNYFFPAWIVGMLLAGLLTRPIDDALPETTPAEPCPQSFGALYVLTPALGTALVLILFRFDADMIVHRSLIEVRSCRLPGNPYEAGVVEEVRDSERPIFCQDLRLALLALGKDAGNMPVPENCVYDESLANGRIKDGGIAERIKKRWFGTLWLLGPDNPWEPLARKSGYQLEAENGLLLKYVRRPPDSTPPARAIE